MKQRYGVTSSNQTTENTLTSLKDKVNSLLSITGGVEKQ